MLFELWTAREELSKHGGDRRSEEFNESNEPLKTWAGYCQDIGLLKKD